jgi:hypothetical protein
MALATGRAEAMPISPDRALARCRRSRPTGEIEEWQDTPEYRPSPEALGRPGTAAEVDAAEMAVFQSPSGTPLPGTELLAWLSHGHPVHLSPSVPRPPGWSRH